MTAPAAPSVPVRAGGPSGTPQPQAGTPQLRRGHTPRSAGPARPGGGRRRVPPRCGDASPGPPRPPARSIKALPATAPSSCPVSLLARSQLSGYAPASARRYRSPRPSPALSLSACALWSQRCAALSPPAAPAAYGPGRRRCRRLYFCCRFPHPSLKIPPKKRRRFTKSFGPLSHVSTGAGVPGLSPPVGEVAAGREGSSGDAHPVLRTGPSVRGHRRRAGAIGASPTRGRGLGAVQGGTGNGGRGALKGRRGTRRAVRWR